MISRPIEKFENDVFRLKVLRPPMNKNEPPFFWRRLSFGGAKTDSEAHFWSRVMMASRREIISEGSEIANLPTA